MSDGRLKECRRYIVSGLCMLAAGSALLLLSGIAALTGVSFAVACAGGAALLLGNGFILFGLLIFCDGRRS